MRTRFPLHLAVVFLFAPLAARATTKAPMSDAQIFAILTAANTGEINEANVAQQQSSNDDVKSFAAMMIKDHGAMNDEGSALASKLGITPENNPTSNKLTLASDKLVKKLQGLNGAAFDRAYVASQVKGHKHVLHLVDQELLPKAKAPELKAMLEKARPTIAMHLKHAEALNAKLKKGARTTENP